ncbi:uncharacterized protein LOC114302581 isoform X2 [Camellia sinensis]|uniref:uncharacterized protein LOC114302581 isoform X2 n=1 Tax=Camellia sinensis TaxID=4442 RepID=UPI001036DBBC|nr:uncharacterized protein LOC114302581 isoform X2 [Camellia sinensis]
MKYLLYMKNVLRALDFVVLIFGEILDIYLLTNLQMQEIYGASGYFIEAESMNKKKCLETIKLTKLSTSDKLEGFCASKEIATRSSFLLVADGCCLLVCCSCWPAVAAALVADACWAAAAAAMLL